LEYTPDDYNEYDVLKIPVSLIVSVLYALKHYIFVIALALGARRSPDLKEFLWGLETDAVTLLMMVPALAVGLAMMKRHPHASDIFRVIWKRGLLLLWLTLAADALVLGYKLFLSTRGAGVVFYFLIFLDIWFIYYLYSTKIIRDVFREFPEPPDTSPPSD
jgi:hypothetical protein